MALAERLPYYDGAVTGRIRRAAEGDDDADEGDDDGLELPPAELGLGDGMEVA